MENTEKPLLGVLTNELLNFIISSVLGMKIGMFRACQNFKIFYSIIRFVFIYMMNVFFCRKRSSDMFLHNKSVLKNRLAIHRNNSISMKTYPPSPFPARIIRAYFENIPAFLRAKLVAIHSIKEPFAIFAKTSWHRISSFQRRELPDCFV